MGLRERKKARTRESIQRHALRLFEAQGYAATTVEQIAAAAEVSPSTFFRYFPTKEETVLYDPVDPLLIEAARKQPAELSLIGVIRATLKDVRENWPAEVWAEERVRQRLVFTEPALRARLSEGHIEGIDMIAGFVAERTGRAPDDSEVRAWAGALTGVLLAVGIARFNDPNLDWFDELDRAFAFIEGGLQL
ncbi:TetR family transcriptional regulator [Amycolatopsis ultiminotia]|uniref:TetR family transcriptional regulator n=2 Tax=Amycolatopsis ultiminotia TaxID=543629 RepID=A0ABP6X243_9PSEU